MFYNDYGEVTEVVAIVIAIKRELLTQKSPRDVPLCGDIRNRKLTYRSVESSTCQMNEAETLTAFLVGSNSSHFFCFLIMRHSLSALQFTGVISIICYGTLSQCTCKPIQSMETEIQIIKDNVTKIGWWCTDL